MADRGLLTTGDCHAGVTCHLFARANNSRARLPQRHREFVLTTGQSSLRNEIFCAHRQLLRPILPPNFPSARDSAYVSKFAQAWPWRGGAWPPLGIDSRSGVCQSSSREEISLRKEICPNRWRPSVQRMCLRQHTTQLQRVPESGYFAHERPSCCGAATSGGKSSWPPQFFCTRRKMSCRHEVSCRQENLQSESVC
jgi:hypothetical protein